MLLRLHTHTQQCNTILTAVTNKRLIRKRVRRGQVEIEIEVEEEEVVQEVEQIDQPQKVEEEVDKEKEKNYNRRTRSEATVQIEPPPIKPRSCRTVNRVAEVDSTSLVKCKTEEKQALSSTRTLQSRSQLTAPAVKPRSQLTAPAVKPRSIYATKASTTVRTIQYAEIKELIEERISRHHQRKTVARCLCNSCNISEKPHIFM